MFCSCLLFKTLYFSDFCLTNFYLNIYRTGINKICRIGRTLEAVDERFEVIFFGPSRDAAVATNFVDKIDLLPLPCSSHDIR